MEKKKNEILVDKYFLCELCGFLGGLHSINGSPVYKHYAEKLTKCIDDSEELEEVIVEKKVEDRDIERASLSFYISNIVHYIYDTYDGDEFEIYTLAYVNMCMNEMKDRECILSCFINAIISIVGGDFNDVYDKIVKHINRRG